MIFSYFRENQKIFVKAIAIRKQLCYNQATINYASPVSHGRNIMTYEVPVCEVIKLDNVDIVTSSRGDTTILDVDPTNY